MCVHIYIDSQAFVCSNGIVRMFAASLRPIIVA